MENKKGFTLIEILVVIAILAGFVAMLVPNFMQIRTKARDTKRKNDLTTLQKSLELYKQNQTPPVYPTALPAPCQVLTDANGTVYIQKTPSEPLTNCTANYYYKRTVADPTQYTLAACLENSKDTDATACPADFTTNTGFGCTGSKCYQLLQP